MFGNHRVAIAAWIALTREVAKDAAWPNDSVFFC
jgi:hypothetical protein